MNNRRHLLVIDPIPFVGGSKVATENILQLLDREKIRITVITADMQSWSWPRLQRAKLIEPKWLARREQGPFYFLRHLLIALQLLLLSLRYGKFDIALGASGPGVDLALYLVKPLLGYKIVQLIHGPVARSRTIGRCLLAADQVHYLESSRDSLLCALSTVLPVCTRLEPPHFQTLQNGLPARIWPTPCQTKRPVIFWAASLLKWKGLEVFLDALNCLYDNERPDTHICYIRPKETLLPVSEAPVYIQSVFWHLAPQHLDRIRSNSNIFVSTSKNEPFGLAILEAMAAGHCIVIPEDGAFWDRTLTDGIHCIKYRPNDAPDLAEKLRMLTQDMPRVRSLGAAAARQAEEYRAETRYAGIKHTLETLIDKPCSTGIASTDIEIRQ